MTLGIMQSRFLAAVLALPLLVIGCAAPEDMPEEEGATDSAITGTVNEGDQYQTTARLNLREGPSTSDDIIITLPLHSTVTIVDGTPENGFYKVDTDEGEGWVFGTYLASGATKTKTAKPAGTATTAKTGTGKIETCKASFYTEGQKTANGENFNTNALTAAHKSLPFNTVVRVTNQSNGKTVDVRINDRGPFVAGRCIDLSRAAFTRIASTSAGVASVTVEVLK
jgi:rare lipoprotein A (peptidoglycan hydrolase)